MLTEDSHDRGGVDIVEYFDKINEGTAIVIVSGTDDIEVALKTFRIGIVDFIQKEDIHTKDDLYKPINKVFNNYDLYQMNKFGKFNSLSAYLASPELVPYWEDAVHRALGVSYQIMVDTLNNSLNNFLPVLREKASRVSFKIDQELQNISGMFWSKGLGCPIWFSAANKKGSLKEPEKSLKSDELYKNDKGKLTVRIWKLINVKRDDFVESVWDDFN